MPLCQYAPCETCGPCYYSGIVEEPGYYGYEELGPYQVPTTHSSNYCPDGSEAVFDGTTYRCVKKTSYEGYPGDSSSTRIKFKDINENAKGVNAVKLASVIQGALSELGYSIDDTLTEIKNDTIKLVTKERVGNGVVDRENIFASVKSDTEDIIIEVKSIRLLRSQNGQKRIPPPENKANEFMIRLKTVLN